jgi:hypothetical protein
MPADGPAGGQLQRDRPEGQFIAAMNSVWLICRICYGFLVVDRGLAVVRGDRGTPESAQRPYGRALHADWRGSVRPHPHLLAHVFQMTGFTVEYLGLREDLVHRDAQKSPSSPNAPEH